MTEPLTNGGPRRKRVLLLLPTFADAGGTQKMVAELGRLLADRYEVFECSFDAGNEKRVFPNDNTVLSLGGARRPGIVGKLTGYIRLAKRLKALKRQHRIDVTISNLWPADVLNFLAPAGDKRLSIFHSSLLGDPQNRMLLKLRAIAGRIYRGFDRVVAVHENLRNELIAVFATKPDATTFINNFVAAPPPVEPAEPAAGGRYRLVTLGRLEPGKNQVALLHIAKGLKNAGLPVQLIVCGDGSERSLLEAETVALGLTAGRAASDDADVIFAGFDPQAHRYFSASDLFVMSSKTEGLPLVVVEALRAGLPAIVADCPTGGVHLVLQGKVAYAAGRADAEQTSSGYLMPIPEKGDAPSLAVWTETISQLLPDAATRGRLADGARLRAEDFSSAGARRQWFALIDTLK